MKDFVRKMILSAVISGCLVFGTMGVFASFENIRQTAFEDRYRAVEITENGIRILDFEFEF